MYLNFIFAAFPDSKVIHVHRNPAATIWSNYKTFFETDGLGYAYDIDDAVLHYELYFKLINFWKERYPDKILDVDYEMLVRDPKAQTMNLINSLQLEWDEKCLYPEHNHAPVRTASIMQIKENIYKDSSSSYKNYLPYLGKALDNLSK